MHQKEKAKKREQSTIAVADDLEATSTMAPKNRTRLGQFRASLFSNLIPRFPEDVPEEMYRFYAKLRVIIIPLLILTVVPGLPLMDEFGMDQEAMNKIQMVNLPLLAIDIFLSYVMWRKPLTVSTLRRITIICLFIEVSTTVLNSWAYGSINSQFLLMGVVIIMITRTAYDFHLGLFVFVAMCIGFILVVALEISGVIEVQPVVLRTKDFLYQSPLVHGVLLVVLLLNFLMTFLVSNWTVARLRHKEYALRVLRHSLSEENPEFVGHYTGRILRDTYVVGRRLGKGGMGEVYGGKHRRTGRDIAIKFLHQHLMGDEHQLLRFQREARILGELDSEHVAEIIDVDKEFDQPFIVMELLIGEDLGHRINRKKHLNVNEISKIIIEVAKGLESAHKAAIVHRDLKPANIFLVNKENEVSVKILDFGVSKIQGSATLLTHSRSAVGTPAYMAPEQMNESAQATHLVDVYALAALSYAALTGGPPFGSGNLSELLTNVFYDFPAPVHEVRTELSPSVWSVITVGMAKDPSLRHQSAQAFASDFVEAINGKEIPELDRKAHHIRRMANRGRRGPDISEGPIDGIETAEISPLKE